ncbi:MAG: cobyrinate a,c-diamide synthase [Clostridia bacterium]|nr:cobyrinate a,c-diamide synthase [Clostridia bacterium]
MKIPGVVIAGTNSGSGKTTITAGIMAALVKKGLKVQPYKVGPDYIDPMFHSFVTGRHSRNLDSWMLDKDVVLHLFAKNSAGADIAVIEGVMGLYDGFGGTSTVGSTAHVAKIVKTPVILVINGEGTSMSLAATVKGFKEFDPDLNIQGIIINNIKTETHYYILKEVIEEYTGVKVVGYLSKADRFSLTSRHLGLIPSGEVKGLQEKIGALAEEVFKTIDLELLLKIAGQKEEIHDRLHNIPGNMKPEPRDKPRVAVAWDKAFNFYYKDNLELLESLGAELVYFSPVEHEELPENLDGLYIGGGYPEIWAKELEGNLAMKEEIRRVVNRGIPAYAECGGLMYMAESITDRDGNSFKMTGIIPGRSVMTTKLQRFGYVELEIKAGCVLSEKPTGVRAHEFHYSSIIVEGDCNSCYRVLKHRKNKEQLSWGCGYKVNNLLAGYPHIHFWANTGLAEGFVENCIRYRACKGYL